MACRRLIAPLVALLALSTVAPALADDVANPSQTFAVGSAPMTTAQGLAKAHWGMDPCGGQVSISWTQLAPQINATSTWTNPVSSYNNPDLNGDCSIQFNTTMDFDWPKFCTVVIHEYGHLSGQPHSPDPNSIMNAYYGVPASECTGIMPGAAPPATPAAPAVAQPASSTSVAPATTARPAALKVATGARVSGAKRAKATTKKVVKRARKGTKKAKTRTKRHAKHHRATRIRARGARVALIRNVESSTNAPAGYGFEGFGPFGLALSFS